MNDQYIPLEHRTVIAISAEDANNFLQGLITNDINKASDTNAIYAYMLTPQGKFLYDFFICMREDQYYIDCKKSHLPEILQKLKIYKLRSKVTITDLSEKYAVVALLGDSLKEHIKGEYKPGTAQQFCKGYIFVDPRSELIYGRGIIEIESNYQAFKSHDIEQGNIDNYHQLRINSSLPEGGIDLVSGESFPLDYNGNELNVIDYKKGCYVGQEVTARVNYKGKIRKKLVKVTADQALPNERAEITQNGKKIGTLTSSIKNTGLALIRTDSIAGNTAQIGDVSVEF